jgi:hypothetical protein
MAENTAPTRKKIERPIRSALESAGRRKSMKKTMTANTESVRN